VKVTWATRECNKWQRTIVCGRIDKDLNRMLVIEMRLSTVFHPQIDRQME